MNKRIVTASPKHNPTLPIESSPHMSGAAGVAAMMWQVNVALLPVIGFAVYAYGLAALCSLLVALAACVAAEYAYCRWRRKAHTIGDGSVVITALLYALSLPPGLPWWMVATGGVVAVLLGKWVFGGLGGNPFNPALVGRAFLQAAFPQAMTTWQPVFDPLRFTTLPTSVTAAPFTAPHYDAVSGATPLAAMKFDHHLTGAGDLLLGHAAGSLGESGALFILAGALYLLLRGIIDWRIPAGVLLAVALLASIGHQLAPSVYAPASFMLLSGGLLLGAFFMATDPVASPITHTGCFVYGLMIGALVVTIRYFGGMPEGVMYAILLANAVSPHIDRAIQPRVYGSRRP